MQQMSTLPTISLNTSAYSPSRPSPLRSRTLGPLLLLLGLISGSIALALLLSGPEPFLIALDHISPFPTLPPPPSSCPVDPYFLPGMLYIHDYSPAETRWVPFASTHLSSSDEVLTFDEVRDRDEVEGVEVDERELMFVDLVEKDYESLEWTRDKVILLVGSSHDRNSLTQMADILGVEYKSWGGHTGGFLHVAPLNLTLVNYFLYGMVDDESADWFELHEERPITFENRIGLLEQRRREEAIGEPDLTVAASLFWDEKLFSNGMNRSHPARVGLTIAEAKWHTHRVSSLLTLLNDLHPMSRLMLRTRHHRLDSGAGARIRLAQLDASGRAAAARVRGVKLFVWGDLLEGWQDVYDHDQHFQPGPPSFLAGNMLLYYLRQTPLSECW